MADTDTATATPDTLAPMENPGLTDMIPYQGSPESVDVNTPNPQSPELQQTPDLTATIPSETAPNNPDIERQYHEAWWRHALDKAGSILGGDTTIHITKDKDGNVTMTHDPSTQGEKWGRVAQAALSGATAGLANAQGPGGLLKAAAAGTQAGLQLPQQREQQAQQSVDFQNKQLLAKANRIYVTQHAYLAAQQAKQAELEHTEETVKAMNADYDAADQSPNSKKVGTIDPSEKDAIIKLAQQNPAAMDAYLHKGNQRLRFVATPDNKMEVFLTDRSWEEQMNDQPTTIKKLDTDDKGNPILTTRTAQPGTVRNGEAYNHNTATTTAYLGQKKTKADADKAEADAQKALKPEGEPKTLPEMNLAIERETDPVKKQQLISARDATVSQQKQLRTVNQVNVGTVPPGTTPESMIGQGGKFAPETVSGTNAQALASGDLLFDELPKRMAKGAATPQEMFAAASAYSKQLYGLGYSPTMISNEKKQFDNIKEQGILNGIDKMMGTAGQQGYLDLVVNLGKQAVGDGSVAPWNEISLAVKKKFGEQAAKNFNTALGEVQRSLPQLIGNPLLGGSDSDLKQRMASDMFGSDKTAGNLLSTAATLKGMLQGTTDSLTRNNRFLQRRYGLRGPYAAQFTPTQPGGGGATQQTQNTQQQQGPTTAPAAQAVDQSNPPPIEKVPPGHDTTFGNGQVWRNTNGKLLRVK